MKLSYIGILVFYLSTGSAQIQPVKLKITPLTYNFFVFTSWKIYGDKPFPSNGLYVLTGEGVILIDTPWDMTQCQPLLDSIQHRHGQKVKLCIATHSHEDRTEGLEYYASQGIKTFTSVQTDKICKERGEKRARFSFKSDTLFNIGEMTFEAFYPGPGHTSDNIVIWFKENKILYGGCFVKSIETNDLGNLADANVDAWHNSITNIQKKFKNPKFIIPGHQDWGSTDALKHTQKLIELHLGKEK